MAEKLWMIAAALLAIVAGVFLWRNNLSAAFVTAVLGVCAGFLSYRMKLRAELPNDDDDLDEEETSEEFSSDRETRQDEP